MIRRFLLWDPIVAAIVDVGSSSAVSFCTLFGLPLVLLMFLLAFVNVVDAMSADMSILCGTCSSCRTCDVME